MFPEGTRTPRGSQGTYKSGAARLAIVSGVPIVPIAASSGQVLAAQELPAAAGHHRRVHRPPDRRAGPPARRTDARGRAWIEAEMRRLDPEAYAGAAGPAGRPAGPAAPAALRLRPWPARTRTSTRCSRCSTSRPPAPAAPTPPAFGHPRAPARGPSRTATVAYELRRARRRSIGFTIGAEGLTVSAPRWVGRPTSRRAAREGGWILRKLQSSASARAPAGRARRLARRHGDPLPGRDRDRGAGPARHRRGAQHRRAEACPACRG
jgi:hypothetical protein